MIKIRIKFITISVLSFKDKINEDEVLKELEIFWSPGEDSPLKHQRNSLVITGQHTNNYWHLVPELEKMCEEDADRIWQQTIWEVNGEFEISNKATLFDEIEKNLGCELEIQSSYKVELVEYFWHLLSAVEEDAIREKDGVSIYCHWCGIEVGYEQDCPNGCDQ